MRRSPLFALAFLFAPFAGRPDVASAQTAPVVGEPAPSDEAPPKDYPPPRPIDEAPLGTGVVRTMSLLATSTPERRNRVTIVVYGQSISKQAWSERLRAELERRYPHAELVFHNPSIGGFSSPVLLRSLEHDVIPLAPDLVIFHVYGGEPEYEAIIREIRTRTTAEVLLQNDFVSPGQKPDWHDKHSWQWLPELARKYGAEVVDVRRGWLDYMADQKLEATALVGRDRAHLNDQGNYLMAALTQRHLRYDPSRPADPEGRVRTYTVGKDVRWKGGRLTLPFDGSRVELVAGASAADGWAHVFIDGKPPSRFEGGYVITRPNADPNRDWPWAIGAPYRIDHKAPLVIEDWTLRFTKLNPDGKSFTFDVRGSVTGEDGTGSTNEPFTSRSGRVVIAPGDWFLDRVHKPQRAAIKPGFVVTWRVVPAFLDAWAPGQGNAVVAQGLPNGRHLLELRAGKPLPLAAIRVYRPMQAAPATVAR